MGQKNDLDQEEIQDDEKVQALQQKIEELEENWKRSVADYRNLEKRVEEEKRELIKYANKDLLLQLLPALETLFLAQKYIEDEGLKITVKRMLDVLQGVGVEKIETEGKEFNPHIMEAVETVNGKENTVIEESRPGFTLYGKLLVPAQVKVGSGQQSKKE